MPTYEYQCDSCNHGFEEFQFFNEEVLVKCPKCKKKKLKRVVSGGLGFSIKGGTSSISQSSSLGGRYIPMDSAEQKFEERMKDLSQAGEV